jgi:uncharacterized membrane protein
MTRIVIVWLHVVAAAVWVGGLAQLSHLVVPAVVRGERGCQALLTRARAISWGALALLVLTALENLRRVGLASPWLAGKLLVVLGLLALAAHRDFALLPRALRRLEGGAPPGEVLRGVRWADRVLLLLVLAVLLLAVGVARGR